MVWPTDRNTAVKAFYREKNYRNERNCYERLANLMIEEVSIFTIPKMVGCHEYLLTIEIGIVSPPRILDFGKAYLDTPPDFTQRTPR